MKISAVIPARLSSTRLPRKVLARVNGKPLIQHVWERVKQVPSLQSVIIVTESEEVVSAVTEFGGVAMMTDPACKSGTERIASIIDKIEADFILNIQGDEPLIDPVMIDALIHNWSFDQMDLVTPIYPIRSSDDLFNPNIVKVVRARDGRALYFSRSPIPYIRDLPKERWLEKHCFWGHIGVYGYRRQVLENYFHLPVSILQEAESLEQLAFLEAGYSIYTVETTYRSVAVDTPDDLEKVRSILAENGS